MHRVLFLMPTRTYRASVFLKAAQQLNIEAVVGTDQSQALEKIVPGKTLVLNFHDPEAAKQPIVELANEYPINAIIPVDEDTAVLAATAAEALSLHHNSVASVYAAREKHRMRKILKEASLPSPQFDLYSIDDDPKEIASQVTFPCVVKPVFLSASRGVIRANDTEEIVQAFNKIVSILQEPEVVKRGGALARQILVETFIPGTEVALEGIFTDGKLKVLAIFDKPDPLDGPYFEETIYVTPSRLPDGVQEEIINCTAKASEAMGMHHGPVHAELRTNEEGPWVIEIAARSIGGHCSRALRFGDGISLEELILRHAIGMEIDSLEREKPASGVMMIPTPYAGILRKVRGQDDARAVPGIEDLMITIPLDQELVTPPEGSKYLGFIFARAETPDQVEASLREAHRRLEFVIES